MDSKKFLNGLVYLLALLFILLYTSLTKASISWDFYTLDSSGSVGMYTSLAMDSNDNPRISYYDSSKAELKYAWCNDGCEYIITDQNLMTLDSSGPVGMYTSLALDSSDNPRISYYDSSNEDLKYAWCNENCANTTNWYTTTLDSSDSVGMYTSLALDSNDNPRISYYDSSNADLKYAWCNVDCANITNWHTRTVDDSGSVGMYTSLALDSSDNPRISYYDSSNEDLKYAWCNVDCANITNWYTTTLDSSDSVGMYTSLALDSNDNPHISYYDDTHEDLKYAYCFGHYCQTLTIDSAGSVGRHTSLDHSYNSISISYYDDTHDDLKYAYHYENRCTIETVDSSGSVGTFSSLTTKWGYPRISYYDSSNNSLKFVITYPVAPTCDFDSECQDGLYCNGFEKCTNGSCSAGERHCDDGNICTLDFCDELTEQCVPKTCDGSILNDPAHPCCNDPQCIETAACYFCEGNFDSDQDCDGTDAATFKADFGRSPFNNPCNNEPQCHGDFDCDDDCDGTDTAIFKSDFGRSSFSNPCPTYAVGEWCTY